MAKRYSIKQDIERRLSQEKGTIYKDAPFRVALVYPSPYRLGMSSLGFQSIYRILNDKPGVCCERSFLPDDVDAHQQARTPLLTYESARPVSDFDVMAFSVAYETEVMGLLDCLSLSGVAFRAEARTTRDPLIIFGGPLTFSNPLPVAPFADVIVMGEGEELIGHLLDWYQDAETREQFLRDVALLPGVYVPSIHGEQLRPVAQANDAFLPAYSPIITPDTELSNMHLVENARGCHRGCTFCVMRRSTNMGMRTVEPQTVLKTIPDYATRVGLVGAATTDHPKLLDIVAPIVESGREIGLSSLRADRLTDDFVMLMKQGGVKTLTVASDGSSERMRKIAKKHIKEKHLIRAAELVKKHGLKQLKLYMVIAYPEETMEDIEEMIRFVGELSKICKVALGMSPLVAKKNTPLDGAPFEDEKQLEAKIKRVHKALGRRVDIRSTSVRWAWIEYQLAQGGFDMADVAEHVWQTRRGYRDWKNAVKQFEPQTAELRKPVDNRLRPGALWDDSLVPKITPTLVDEDVVTHHDPP